MLQQQRNSARSLAILLLLAGLCQAGGCNWGLVLGEGGLLGDTVVELIPPGGSIGEQGEGGHQLLGKVLLRPS